MSHANPPSLFLTTKAEQIPYTQKMASKSETSCIIRSTIEAFVITCELTHPKSQHEDELYGEEMTVFDPRNLILKSLSSWLITSVFIVLKPKRKEVTEEHAKCILMMYRHFELKLYSTILIEVMLP